MVAVVDYGVGNLFSLVCSLRSIGAEAEIVNSPENVRNASKILLPGVGAFADAARLLRETGLGEAVCDAAADGKPLLGICLGMQLLFERSFEYGEHRGLGLIPGDIVPIETLPNYKIPQIGWNSLDFPKERQKSPIFKYTADGDYVYFVHSYHASCDERNIIATTEYGARITAAAANRNVYGCQFHPEKSGKVGLNILRAFCEL